MAVADRFRLVHADARRRAIDAVARAPDGHVVRISPPSKSREQECYYHALIGDIARQLEFAGEEWHADDWKRLLVDAFALAMRDAGKPLRHDGRVVPSLDGARVVQLGVQTAKFTVGEAADFVEYLLAFGADHNVQWSAVE